MDYRSNFRDSDVNIDDRDLLSSDLPSYNDTRPHNLSICMTHIPDSVAIEHQNVPTNHQGLHDFLYSAADEHGTATTQIRVELDSDRILPLTEWQSLIENDRVAVPCSSAALYKKSCKP